MVVGPWLLGTLFWGAPFCWLPKKLSKSTFPPPLWGFCLGFVGWFDVGVLCWLLGGTLLGLCCWFWGTGGWGWGGGCCLGSGLGGSGFFSGGCLWLGDDCLIWDFEIS